MDIELKRWLDFKNRWADKIVHYPSKYDKDAYYEKKDDIDVDKDDLFLKDIISSMKLNNLEEYEIPEDIIDSLDYNDHIILDYKTNHYHCNYLFRQLIDYTIDHDSLYNAYEYPIYLINLYMKKSFYKFCKSYS